MNPAGRRVTWLVVGLMFGWGGWQLTAQEGEVATDPQARLAQLQKRVAEEPRADRYFELAQLLFKGGDPAKGFSALAEGIKIAPDGHHMQSYFLYQLDKTEYKARLQLVQSLHKILPDYPPLLERLGRLYQGQGKDKQAEVLFRKWVTKRPDSAEAHSRLGEFLRVTGKLEPAAAEFETVRTLLGESTYALRRLGVVYREAGKLEKSAERLMEANDLVEAGNDIVALTELGHTRMAQKQSAQAVAAFRKVTEIDPGSPVLWLSLAQAQAQAGDDKAIATYEKVIGMDKFNSVARLGLGKLLLSKNQPAKALPHLREASSANDRDSELHFLVGTTALAAGDLEGAKREHAKLKQIRSNTLAKKLYQLLQAQAVTP